MGRGAATREWASQGGRSLFYGNRGRDSARPRKALPGPAELKELFAGEPTIADGFTDGRLAPQAARAATLIPILQTPEYESVIGYSRMGKATRTFVCLDAATGRVCAATCERATGVQEVPELRGGGEQAMTTIPHAIADANRMMKWSTSDDPKTLQFSIDDFAAAIAAARSRRGEH